MDSSRRLNPEHIERVKLLADASPFLNLLGVKLVELDKDYCRTEVVVTRRSAQRVRRDPRRSVCGHARQRVVLVPVLRHGRRCRVHHASQSERGRSALVDEGLVVTEGRAIKYGSTICLERGLLARRSGRILAHATSKFLCILEASAHIGRGPHGESRALAAEVPATHCAPVSRPCETVHCRAPSMHFAFRRCTEALARV